MPDELNLFDALWQAVQTRTGITHSGNSDVKSTRQDADSIEVFKYALSQIKKKFEVLPMIKFVSEYSIQNNRIPNIKL